MSQSQATRALKNGNHSPRCLDWSPFLGECIPACRYADVRPAALDKRPPTPRPAGPLATAAILAAPVIAFIGGTIAGYAAR